MNVTKSSGQLIEFDGAGPYVVAEGCEDVLRDTIKTIQERLVAGECTDRLNRCTPCTRTAYHIHAAGGKRLHRTPLPHDSQLACALSHDLIYLLMIYVPTHGRRVHRSPLPHDSQRKSLIAGRAT